MGSGTVVKVASSELSSQQLAELTSLRTKIATMEQRIRQSVQTNSYKL